MHPQSRLLMTDIYKKNVKNEHWITIAHNRPVDKQWSGHTYTLFKGCQCELQQATEGKSLKTAFK